MTAQQLKNGVGAPVSKTPVKKAKKLTEMPAYLRLMMFGRAGTGKTYILGPLVEKGLKVIVLDSDVGGNGLNTVRSYLKQKGKRELLDNIILIPIEKYEEAVQFVSDPEKYFNSVVEGTTWAEFNADLIYWEGFGNFQQVHIWKFVSDNTNPVQDVEAFESYKEWGEVLRATHFAIDDFGKIKGPNGKEIHKIWSTHLNDGDVDPTGKKIDPKDSVQKGRLKQAKKPLLSGRGAAMVLGAADYVIHTFTETEYDPVKKETKVSYCWDMTPASVLGEGKVRGKMLEGGPIIKNVDPLQRWNEMIANID